MITHVNTSRYAGFAAKVSYLYSDRDGWVENVGSGSQYPSTPENQLSGSNDDSVDPMVTLGYQWDEDLNTYLRYATSYKSGSVNLRSATFASYDPEEVESYELGVNSTFRERRARLNTALWTSNFADYQIDFSDPADISISEAFNASNVNVELWGREMEFSVIPVESSLVYPGSDTHENF